MTIYYAVFLFIVGTVMGSFFHVVGSRLSVGESIVKPGSHCSQCNHPLKWYELVPIVSYLFQKGRCRVCKVRISLWYPLVELLTGILYLGCYLLYGFSYDFGITLLIGSLLIVVCVSDFGNLIIPDEVLLVASIVLLAIQFSLKGVSFGLHSLLAGVSLFVFMLLVKFLGDFIFKRDSMGGGDIKLAFFMGCALGFRASYMAILLGSLLALPYAFVVSRIYQNREVPFGPFLLMGTLLAYALNPYIQFLFSYYF